MAAKAGRSTNSAVCQLSGRTQWASCTASSGSQDLVDLYQLSSARCGVLPNEVASTGLDILRQHRGDRGRVFVGGRTRRVRLQLILPHELADRLRLHKKLTDRVSRDRCAIWVKDQLAGQGRQAGFADAICIPLLNEASVVGAIHLYREQGSFEQSHFDFAVSVGTMLAVALQSSRAHASLSAEHQRLVQRTGDFHELIGESAGMQRLKDRIARVARASGCALVRGESGVGKELVARAIHRLSLRAIGRCCASTARHSWRIDGKPTVRPQEGVLYGADRDHVGLFQQAHTGTLFLDEVGELTLEGQAKLLRILEGHPFLPVGIPRK